MIARPVLVLGALAAAGASALLFVDMSAPPPVYLPAGLGALVVALASARLLRELRPRDRAALAGGAGGLGFLVGAISGVGPFPASLPPDPLRARYGFARAVALEALGERDAARLALEEAAAAPGGAAEVRRFRPAAPASASSLLDGPPHPARR